MSKRRSKTMPFPYRDDDPLIGRTLLESSSVIPHQPTSLRELGVGNLSPKIMYCDDDSKPALGRCLLTRYSNIAVSESPWKMPKLSAPTSPFKVNARINIHHLLNLDGDKETFKLIFDLILHWEDPLVRYMKSTVHFVNGRTLTGIVNLDWQKDTVTIVKPRRKKGIPTCKYDSDENIDTDNESDFDDEDDDGIELECPAERIHHIETKALGKLAWTPSEKFTVGAVTSPDNIIQQEAGPELLNGIHGRMRIFRKYVAEFRTKLDLQDFPFDCQKLKFDVTSIVRDTTLVFSDDHGPNSCGRSQCRIEEDSGAEWEVDWQRQKEEGTGFCRKLPAANASPAWGYSQIIGQLFVKRRPNHYMQNYTFALFLMTLLSFGVFAVPITDVAGRCGITVTLFLAIVCIKLLMAEHLPRKPYLTKIEKYVIFTFIVVCVPLIGQIFFLFGFCRKDDISKISRSDAASSSALLYFFADGYDCDEWIIEADHQLMVVLAADWMLLHVLYGLLYSWKGNVPCIQKIFSKGGTSLLLLFLVGPLAFYGVCESQKFPNEVFTSWAWVFLAIFIGVISRVIYRYRWTIQSCFRLLSRCRFKSSDSSAQLGCDVLSSV